MRTSALFAVLLLSPAAAAPAAAQFGREIDRTPACRTELQGCVSLRVDILTSSQPAPVGTLDPYFPQERAQGLYRASGIPQDPFSCVRIGDGSSIALRTALVVPFVPFREAIMSGLRTSEYEQYLDDVRNYSVWRPEEYRARADRDPAAWIPDRNSCWYVSRYLATKERWSLAVDPAEEDAIQDVLDTCSWDDLVPSCGPAGDYSRARVDPAANPPDPARTLEMRNRCDTDLDGRVSCAEVTACRVARPVLFGHPLYPLVTDVDRDGVACR